MARRLSGVPAVLLVAGSVAAIALLAHSARRMLAPRHEKRRQRSLSQTAVEHAPVDDGDDHQRESSGVGELTHRRYMIDVPRAEYSRQSLNQAIQQRVHELAPAKLADFEKTAGNGAFMSVGDEYDVTMLGPWNGRVRVAEVTDDSFTLITLEGHPEAGHITFSVQERSLQPETFTIVIESWARARDNTVHVAYNTLAVGRQVQAEVWVTFLQRVAALTGCEEVPEVRIDSEELIT